MSKNLIILIIILTLILSSLVFLVIQQTRKATGPTTPDEVQFFSPAPDGDLFIISTTPTDQASSMPLDQQTKIAFNRNLSTSEVDFLLSPSVSYSFRINGNTLTATPDNQLVPGLTYYYYVVFRKTNKPSALYSFTTIGEPPDTLPDTFSPATNQAIEEYNLKNYPDIYLANRLPYSANEFNITKGGVRESETRFYYYFIVELSGDKKTAREAFLAWLRSLGLTDNQIQNLDIEY